MSTQAEREEYNKIKDKTDIKSIKRKIEIYKGSAERGYVLTGNESHKGAAKAYGHCLEMFN